MSGTLVIEIVKDIRNNLCSICVGTSTKYDYLSTYTSSIGSGSGGGGGSSSYDRSPYYKSSTYASVIDTDELTKNYFEKYYNRSSASTSGYSVLEREVNAR